MFPISSQVGHLKELMDVAEMRHRVISHNLANINTPGYKRLDVEFEAALAEQVKKGTAEPGKIVPQITEEQGLVSRADGNNVDIDREVAQLNKNAMLFQAYSQMLGSQFDLMRRAIRGA